MNRKLIFGIVVPSVAMLLLTTSLTFAQEKQPLAIKQPVKQVKEQYHSKSMDKEVLIAQASSLRQPSTVPTATQNVKVEKIRPLSTQVPPELSGNGFTVRHDWGDRNGFWRLTLNIPGATKNSLAFVAIGECAAGGGSFVGDAVYTLHNVAPRDGGVDIRVNIGWSSPIRLCADYLIINP